MTEPDGPDLIVVGAGPAGLAAALALARRGIAVTVLERGDRVGGMAASIEVAGQRVDLGSHRLHPSAPAPVRRLLDELLGDDLQERERDGRLRLAGRWVRFPFRPLDLARSVPPRLAARLATDLARAGSPASGSYADFVRAGLGPTALASFHGPMAEKLWGRPADELSSELARRRIAVRDRRSVVDRLARTARPSGRTFRYPRLGYGQIAERLADAAADAGATIRLGVAVESVAPGAGGRVQLAVDGAPTAAARVLWTAPHDALLRAAGGPPGSATAHRALVLVYLAIARDRWTRFDAHYVPDHDVRFARLSEPKNYRDGPDPAGVTVLCAEIPCDVGDAIWRAERDDLREVVLDGLRRCDLPVPAPGEIVEVEVVRLPGVYPVVPAGEEERRADSLRWTLPGVTVLGRQGLAVADNLHHVLDMGLSAASCLHPDGSWDDAGWTAHRRRFDEFVVDD